jgi:hypothetical protein
LAEYKRKGKVCIAEEGGLWYIKDRLIIFGRFLYAKSFIACDAGAVHLHDEWMLSVPQVDGAYL